MAYRDISPEEFKDLSGKENYHILDVRAEKEYEEGLISNHTLIDYFQNDFKEQIEALDKSVNYLIYCRSGNRSGKACQMMEELGFTGELYNLDGGIQAWNQSYGKKTE